MKRCDVAQAILKQHFYYDERTGIFTRISTQRATGTPVKSGPNKGYVRIMFLQNVYLAHRLAWLYAYGSWPQLEIDHINKDKGDNRLVNLREATRSQNMINAPTRKNNRSGYRGVFWCNTRNMWVACISVHGRKKYLGKSHNPEKLASIYKEHYEIANSF